jgi:MATE family multidrug resistance protein
MTLAAARGAHAEGSDDEDESAPLVSPIRPATPGADGMQGPPEEPIEWWHEVKDLLRLAVPIFISRVSGTAKAITDTALLGHIDTDSRYLLASAMSDMWTQSTGVFMNGRVLGTFCSQAFGAGNKQLAGVWLQVSLCVVTAIAVPVAILWGSTHWVLHSVLGQPEQISSDAAYYSMVMLVGIPARLVFGQTSQFLQAQRIMRPAAQLSVLTCILNLAAGWYFVLGLPGPLARLGGGYGFVAMPIVTLFCEYVQCALLLLYFCWYKGLHRECWPDDGLSIQHVTKHRASQYIRLYMPAAIVGASDWWRVAAIGAIAVTLGDKELAVFNTSYRVLWLANIFNGALSGATGVKLGMALGAGQPQRCVRMSLLQWVLTPAPPYLRPPTPTDASTPNRDS